MLRISTSGYAIRRGKRLKRSKQCELAAWCRCLVDQPDLSEYRSEAN